MKTSIIIVCVLVIVILLVKIYQTEEQKGKVLQPKGETKPKVEQEQEANPIVDQLLVKSYQPVWQRLLAAIREVESGGNDLAVGDGGRSKGPYQISKPYWQDACEQGGLDWKYEDLVWDEPTCRVIILLYWERYAPAGSTAKTLARIHNGGPKGHLKASTKGYWQRVKSIMEN